MEREFVVRMCFWKISVTSQGFSFLDWNFGKYCMFPADPFVTGNSRKFKPEFFIESESAQYFLPSVYILCSFERRLEVLELIRPFMFYRKMKLFIENHLTTPKFLLVLHGGDGGNGAALKCLKLAKKFYQLLKNRWVSEICGYNISLKRCKIISVTGLMVLQVYSRWLSYWPSSFFACFRLYSDVVVDLTCTYYINERQNETNVHSSSYHWISSSRKSTLPFYFAYSIDFNKQRIDSTSMNLVKQNKKFYGFSQC